MLAVIFGAEWFRTYVSGGPFTIESDHNPLESILRRALQIHLPGCSTCFYACKGMIMFFATTLVRKWPSQMHSHISNPSLALRLHWILPSTIPTCPLSERKPSNWLLRWILRCMPLLLSSSLAGPMTSRKAHTHYVPTGNTVNHTLLRMDLCSMEKPSSFLHQKGRRSLVLGTYHTKALPKHSYLPMIVSSCLVTTRPLRRLFGNVKHA